MSAIKKQKNIKSLIDRRELQKRIGNFLKEQRESSGVSLRELSSSIGILPDLLAEYELGARKVPLNHVYGIANSLNIAPELIVRFFNQLSIEL